MATSDTIAIPGIRHPPLREALSYLALHCTHPVLQRGLTSAHPAALNSLGQPRVCACIARQMRSGVAGIGMSVTPSGARASRIAFMTVGVLATVPPSPTPLAPNGLVGLGTGLKSTATRGTVSARGMP